MSRNAYTTAWDARPFSFGRLYRSRRFVTARVLDGGREVDRFQAASPKTLRAALARTYRHMPRNGGAVELTGVEERWLPFGIKKVRKETLLGHLDSAADFLGE